MDKTLDSTRTLTQTADGRSLAEVYKATLGRKRRTSLLIYHRDGAELVPLRPGQPVVVGRTREADVTIREASLSRRHARFELVEDQVWVEDLGSTNGTQVNGERVQRCQVGAMDQITLGSLPVSINALDPLEEGLYGLDSHDRFRTCLEEELTRARMFGRKLALILAGAAPGPRERLQAWCPDVRRLLRSFDRLGHYGPETVEVLYAEATREQADELVDRIVAVGQAAGVSLCCGAALFPDCGTSLEELQEVARLAHQEARAAGPVQWAPVTAARELEAPAPREETEEEVAAAGGEGQGPLRGAKMQRVYEIVERVAPKSIPVLIRGETGTGKEVLARDIHERSERRERPLCCVNCGALPEQLVESTLFGHEKGAFTGAHAQAKGIFETAHQGTVLLDEIGELPPAAQATLLRVLESKRFNRVGSAKEIEVDVRVLAATHRDLEAMSREGTFRQDLLFRLNVVTIDLPPLRDRTEEIVPLAYHFIKQANEANGCSVTRIAPEALELLRAHTWPGNIRELRNVLERGTVIARGDAISVDDLPASIRRAERPVETQEAAAVDLEQGLKGLVQQYEAQVIRQALEQNDWDRRTVAKLLGVSLRTLAYKLSQYGIKIRER